MAEPNQANTNYSRSTSPFAGSTKLFVLGFISLVCYIYWFRLSFGPLQRGNYDDLYITNFLITFAILFVCYWLLIMPLLKGKAMDPRHLWFAIAFGLIFRAIMLPSDLMMEDDIYRYMWDGHMILEGVNPYEHAPSSPDTEPYRTDYWNKINYPYVPTIYPPTLQYIFLAANVIYPGSVVGMKFILLLFDIGTIFLLLALLRNLQLPQEWCLVYSWSPLIIKEIANSGHADTVSAFLLVAVLWFMSKQKMAMSSITLALMTLTKFFGLFLLPLFHRAWKWRLFALYAAALFILYIPFISFEINLFKGFLTFSKEWLFNAGIYEWVRDLYRFFGWSIEFTFQGEIIYWGASELARYSLMGIVILVVMYQTIMMEYRREILDLSRSIFIVLGTLLMVSPVINTWYLTWIIPLICIHPSRAWLVFTGLVFLSYTFYYDLVFPEWVKPLEYGAFFTLLIIEYLRPSWRIGIQHTDNNQTEVTNHAS